MARRTERTSENVLVLACGEVATVPEASEKTDDAVLEEGVGATCSATQSKRSAPARRSVRFKIDCFGGVAGRSFDCLAKKWNILLTERQVFQAGPCLEVREKRLGEPNATFAKTLPRRP